MKNQRIIKKNYEFQNIINKRKTVSNGCYVIYFENNDAKNNGLNYGISVGKKLGNAVARNYVKRTVRMIIQKLLPEYETLNVKIIVIVRNNFFKKDFNTRLRELRLLLKEINKNNK